DAALVERLQPLLVRLGEAVRPSGVAPQVNLVDLLRFPGVLAEPSADPEALLGAARELFDRTLADLKAMRAREGARLKDLLLQRCEGVAALTAQVRERLPEVQATIRQRYAEIGRASCRETELISVADLFLQHKTTSYSS